MGQTGKRKVACENLTFKYARRSLVANIPLKAGPVLTKNMLGVKRPGTGILPSEIDKVVGKVLKTDLAQDSQIKWEHLN